MAASYVTRTLWKIKTIGKIKTEKMKADNLLKITK